MSWSQKWEGYLDQVDSTVVNGSFALSSASYMASKNKNEGNPPSSVICHETFPAYLSSNYNNNNWNCAEVEGVVGANTVRLVENNAGGKKVCPNSNINIRRIFPMKDDND